MNYEYVIIVNKITSESLLHLKKRCATPNKTQQSKAKQTDNCFSFVSLFLCVASARVRMCVQIEPHFLNLQIFLSKCSMIIIHGLFTFYSISARKLIANNFFHFIPSNLFRGTQTPLLLYTKYINNKIIITAIVCIFPAINKITHVTFIEICLYCEKYLRNAKESQNM